MTGFTLVPFVDDSTFLFPKPTMDALATKLGSAVSGQYVLLTQASVAYDTDGVAYFTSGVPFASAVPIQTDTDGVPYLTA
jgi:hypothetical protein